MNVEMYRNPAPARCDACGHQLWLHDHRGCHVLGCTRCGRRWCRKHVDACPANCQREQTRRSIESFVLVAAIYAHSAFFAVLVMLSFPIAVIETVAFAFVCVRTIRWYVRQLRRP